MSQETVKFRCTQCAQLLGISARKAGKRIRCPKCGAELIVPSLEPGPVAGFSSPQAPSASEAGGPGATPAPEPPSGTVPSASSYEWPSASEAEGSGPSEEPPRSGVFDTLDLNPEDLRSLFPEPPPPKSRPAGEPAAEPPAPGGVDVKPTEEEIPVFISQVEPEPPRPSTSGSPASRTEEPAPAPQAPSAPPAPSTSGAEVAVPTAWERPAEGPEIGPVRVKPSRDVVLPRLAVLFWSFFVILALFVAFVAGLLVGRFLWDRPIVLEPAADEPSRSQSNLRTSGTSPGSVAAEALDQEQGFDISQVFAVRAFGEAVALVPSHHEPDGHVVGAERLDDLTRLVERHARVVHAVHDQERGADALRLADR